MQIECAIELIEEECIRALDDMKLAHELFRAISHAKSGLKQSKIPTNPQLPEGTIKHKSMLIC